jgi:hypothetical protein
MATEAELKAELAKYKTARDKILSTGQSVSVGGDQFTRATFFRLEDKIVELENRIAFVRRGGFARSTFVGRG